MAEEYTDEIREAVRTNIEYLVGNDAQEVALFLESIGETLYNGELLEQVAAALRDLADGA